MKTIRKVKYLIVFSILSLNLYALDQFHLRFTQLPSSPGTITYNYALTNEIYGIGGNNTWNCSYDYEFLLSNNGVDFYSIGSYYITVKSQNTDGDFDIEDICVEPFPNTCASVIYCLNTPTADPSFTIPNCVPSGSYNLYISISNSTACPACPPPSIVLANFSTPVSSCLLGGGPCLMGTVNFTNPTSTPLQVQTTANTATCGNNGALAINISNGVPNFDISWSGPVNGSLPTQTALGTHSTPPNLPPGTYVVTVTDNNCTYTETETIANQVLSIDQITTVDADCGIANGLATISMNFGIPPYAYIVTGPSPCFIIMSSSSETCSGLLPGAYTVQASDGTGCTVSGSFVINGNLMVNAGPDQTLCDGECVTLQASVSPPGSYNYTWIRDGIYTVGTGQSICVQPPGGMHTYTVNVTDGGFCIGSDQLVIDHFTGINACALPLNNGCCKPAGTIGGSPFLRTAFQNTYGTPLKETVGVSNPPLSGAVTETSDGGFVMAAYTKDVGFNGFSDYYITKVDPNGDLFWTKQYGDEGGFSFSTDITETSDLGLAITGAIGLKGTTLAMHLMKTHANGALAWDKAYIGSSSFTTSRSVMETRDGGFIIGGYTPDGGERFIVVRTDHAGDIKWHYTYRSTSNSYFSKVIETHAGNFLLLGSTLAGSIDGYVVLVDANGHEIWSANYGTAAGAEELYDAVEANDGGFVLCGYTTGAGSGLMDGLILRISASGEVLGSRTYGSSGNEHFNSITKAGGRGYLLAGRSNSFNATGDYDMYVARTRPNGNEVWSRVYGTPQQDEGRDIIRANDGGLVVFGVSQEDLYLVKTDENGDPGFDGSACGEHDQVVDSEVSTTLLVKTDISSTIGTLPGFAAVDHPAYEVMGENHQHNGCFSTCPIADAGGHRNACRFSLVTIGTPGTGQLNYQWYLRFRGSLYRVGSNPTLSFFAFFTGNLPFMLEVTDPVTGCVATDEIIVKVLPRHHPDCRGANKTDASAINRNDLIDLSAVVPAFSAIQLYPNPATDQVRITYYPTDGQSVSIDIMDLAGRLIQSVQVDNWPGEADLDLSDLNAGLYILTLSENGSLLKAAKLIKQ